MAKRFKFKLSRVIPSFQLCRSKKSSSLPETPVSLIHRLSPVNPKALDIAYPNIAVPAPPTSTPDYSFIQRHLSPKIASVGCGCRSSSCTQYLSPEVSVESPDYSWKKEATRLHVVARAQNSKLEKKHKEKKTEKVKAIGSVSSHDSGYFSSEGVEHEETETLFSTSRSLSDNSSIELDHKLVSVTDQSSKKNKEKVNNSKKLIRLRSFGSKKHKGIKTTGAPSSKHIEAPSRNSMSRRRIPCSSAAEWKVTESMAVVKKSEDPYEDFKRSMLEMILEKQMFEATELEQLLQCFLSLNSRQYHEVIVEAFTEIWEALFCDFPMNVL